MAKQRERDGATYHGNRLAHVDGDHAELTRVEAVRLLASVPYGRVIFTLNALPAARPVNHVIDDGQVIICAWLNPKISAAERSTDGVVVGYQADSLDARRQTGWSVSVTGRAHTLTDPEQVSRYERMLDPWLHRADTFVSIDPAIVNGFRISQE
ncbi:pyridoxamine 5'-phosphate oxidase family protein [Mycolicibacterium chubuense]|uniref:Pyridoxamine 5'-phosphate oxidase n=1 Tax=Mycolicibacterium chubuense TaxID=1800 RepID=A0A0J6VTF6_MYCCU|nr:pyridoxamine 5'-phosphate oxidase family protein [Mycolicibacterium chubuense]KMO72758.1 Pyridoxamine 5'-phosphate oxidase [Mycolicibacterium chubuense]SPX99736.1 Pyridoxamine 5'-phosphate oxidase [Mycolicibacterium chubuense]